jgi:hypothetical protein
VPVDQNGAVVQRFEMPQHDSGHSPTQIEFATAMEQNTALPPCSSDDKVLDRSASQVNSFPINVFLCSYSPRYRNR